MGGREGKEVKERERGRKRGGRQGGVKGGVEIEETKKGGKAA